MGIHFHFSRDVPISAPPVPIAADASGPKTEDSLRTFLIESIKDIQGVVRGIDFKINVLLVLLTVPILHLAGISHAFLLVREHHPDIRIRLYLGGAFLAMLWLSAWWIGLMALFGNYNPAALVQSSNVTGAFYCPGSYSRGIRDLFFPPKRMSPLSLQHYLDKLPIDGVTVNRELSFEVVKLALIRDIKQFRYSRAAVAGLAALASGMAAYAVARVGGWI